MDKDMDKDIPLRRIYDPGEFLCTWVVPDTTGVMHKLPGSVEVRADRPPRGTIYGEVPLAFDSEESGQRSASFPQRYGHEVITATLANGGRVLMLDSHLELWSGGSADIYASAALLGKGDVFSQWLGVDLADGEDDPASVPLVSTVTFQISGLDSLHAVVPIVETSTPALNKNLPRNKWTATTNSSLRQTWSEDEHELSVAYLQRARVADGYEFRMRFSPVATYKFAEPQTLRRVIDDWVEPLRRIASVSIGKPQVLTYLSVELAGGKGGALQVFGTGITQEPRASSSEWVRKNASTVRIGPDNVSLLAMVRLWRELAHSHHPLVETYGSMLHVPDSHPRSRFLLLVQALEGMHGFETREAFDERKAKHQDRRTEVLRQAKVSLDRESYMYIRDTLPRVPLVSLESSLRAMFDALPFDATEELSETNLVQEVIADPRAQKSVLGALRVVRNDLAHGNRGYDATALDEAVEILERAVRAHALRLLGCRDEILTRVSKPK